MGDLVSAGLSGMAIPVHRDSPQIAREVTGRDFSNAAALRDYFDHERLDVYQMARRFNREVSELLKEVPRGHAESKDNLARASKSITRNIAEGSGKWKVPDKIRFYHISRGSATEAAASLDEFVDFGLLTEERAATGKEILSRIVAMLVSLIRSLESRDSAAMAP